VTSVKPAVESGQDAVPERLVVILLEMVKSALEWEQKRAISPRVDHPVALTNVAHKVTLQPPSTPTGGPE